MNHTTAWDAEQTKPFDLIGPASFNPDDFLTGRLRKHTDETRYLVGSVLLKHLTRDDDAKGFARMHHAVWRQTVNHRHLRPLLKELEANQVLERDPSYEVGVKSMGYRLHSRFDQDRHVRQQPTTELMRRKLAEIKERFRLQQQATWKPIHYKLREIQHHSLSANRRDAERILTTLADESRKAQTTLVRRLYQGILLDDLSRRSMGFSVSSTGRVFNGLTGIQRELRPACRIDRQPMGEVDLVSCQPAMLALLMRLPRDAKTVASYKLHAAKDSYSPSDDEEDFTRLACQGGFYKRLEDRTGWSNDEVKLRLMADVLAPRHLYSCPMRSVFEDEFPTVAKFIRQMNRKDPRELIRRLQSMESSLVIETVAPKLVDRIPIVTVHDAIFCRENDVGVVADAFNEAFDEIGFRMALKAKVDGKVVAI